MLLAGLTERTAIRRRYARGATPNTRLKYSGTTVRRLAENTCAQGKNLCDNGALLDFAGRAGRGGFTGQ